MDVDFYNQNQCMPSCAGVLKFTTTVLSDSWYIITRGPLLSPCNSFSIMFFYRFGLSVIFFCSYILLQNSYASFVGMYSSILYLLVGWILFLLFWKAWYCFTSFRYLLCLPYFAYIFWSIYSSWIVRIVCCFVLIFSSQHSSVFFSFLSIFACCYNFFTSPSNLISQANFVLAYIN